MSTGETEGRRSEFDLSRVRAVLWCAFFYLSYSLTLSQTQTQTVDRLLSHCDGFGVALRRNLCHIRYKGILRDRRGEYWTVTRCSSGFSGEAARFIAPGPVSVSLPVQFPSEKQFVIYKLLKDLLEPFKREILSNRRDATPNHTEVCQLKRTVSIRETINPRIFGLSPLRAAGEFFGCPQSVVVDDTFRHQRSPARWRTNGAQSEFKVASLEGLEPEHRFGSPLLVLLLSRACGRFSKSRFPLSSL